MKFIENIKNIFKKSDKSKDNIPNIIKNKDEERIDYDKLLKEQFAEDQKRKKDWEEKSLEEIKTKHKERIKAKERLTKQLAEERTQEKAPHVIYDTYPDVGKSAPIIQDDQKGYQEKSDEEQRKLDEIAAKERKIIEKERLMQIHALNRNETYIEYLKEAEKFRKEFGKDIRCCIGGEWEVDLYVHRGQTYCEKHIPPEFHRENERKIIAGRHDSARDFIKK
jgi:paraquat-inducible protein B